MRDTTDKEKELKSDLFLDIDGGIARGITMRLGAYEHSKVIESPNTEEKVTQEILDKYTVYYCWDGDRGSGFDLCYLIPKE